MISVSTSYSLSPNHESYQLQPTIVLTAIDPIANLVVDVVPSYHVSALLNADVYLVTTQVTQSYMARPCTYFHFSLWRHFCHHIEKQSNHNGHMVAS